MVYMIIIDLGGFGIEEWSSVEDEILIWDVVGICMYLMCEV